jgi:hypothetical protein
MHVVSMTWTCDAAYQAAQTSNAWADGAGTSTPTSASVSGLRTRMSV